MRTKLIILKYLCLLIGGSLPFIKIFQQHTGSLIYLISFLFFLSYYILGFFEIKNISVFQKQLSGPHFPYVNFSIFFKRLLLIALVALFIFLFFAPETRYFKIQPFLIAYAIGEILFFILELNYKIYGFNFYKDFFICFMNREKKFFAEEVHHVSIKYDIYYIIFKSGRVLKINPDYCSTEFRSDFIGKLSDWITDNKIVIKENNT